MAKKPEDIPIFVMGTLDQRECDGMTLRDWFAGQALSGMAIPWNAGPGPLAQSRAVAAYTIADAMLAAREENS